MANKTTAEIFTQPDTWTRAVALAATSQGLPVSGERIAVIGCGTSWFMAQSYCVLREQLGQGVSDAFTSSLYPLARDYDRVVLLSRSGTTTEMVDIAKELEGRGVPTVLVTAVGEGPIAPHVTSEIVLDFADEESVVQTRFATSALTLFRASLGEDLSAAIADCRQALDFEVPASWVSADQVSFLGDGWCWGLANEAGLKWREASQSWTESYPAMEYRHGPIAIAQPGRLTWVFGEAPAGMAQQVADTGAEFLTFDLDPVAALVLAQRVAVLRAEDRKLDPDNPRHLTRAVILPDGGH
ncbi:glucosamine--fructose-6-phosphate aminotransferase [Actinomyces bovis]|uniref:Glucosamine--fructose-6-phosphate aminotransferase n=1 Tax=Actinomyces bovis TaxID=1658 RepID=A0ABY1VKD5_9ACTO|nr:SIS domain-containing protein [Actinomyces bovis]SPT52559.1 glucosamine--fructose-6-phosphate aminotransferase [Actinomyces bovis]VEG54332.1 glucosamine--fructose-6-phosphate aminotransferase [Actinomyces israelii]